MLIDLPYEVTLNTSCLYIYVKTDKEMRLHNHKISQITVSNWKQKQAAAEMMRIPQEFYGGFVR